MSQIHNDCPRPVGSAVYFHCDSLSNVANVSIEEVDFPLKFLAGKGKEREPPLLRLRLHWAGRIAKAEALALPTRPPGKMFRLDATPVPMTPEEKVGDQTLTTWRNTMESPEKMKQC